jgi:hypothetical protein
VTIYSWVIIKRVDEEEGKDEGIKREDMKEEKKHRRVFPNCNSLFWRYSVGMPARASAILIDNFHVFPQSHQKMPG